MRRSAVPLALVGLACAGLVGGLAGCSSAAGPAASAAGRSSSSVSGSITVFAAASLTEAFARMGHQFEAAHPGVTVTFSFAASSALAAQITSGAPADVFASASTKNMEQVVDAEDASTPTPFARNVMEIAVPPADPGHVSGVGDLARPSVTTAVCQPQVPCGSTALKVFDRARITVRPVTLEPDVKSVLGKVELGEVDAGLVYVTDVRAAGTKVRGVPIADDVNASTTYPIAALARSGNPATAAAFVAYVLSPAGQRVLSAAGFERP